MLSLFRDAMTTGTSFRIVCQARDDPDAGNVQRIHDRMRDRRFPLVWLAPESPNGYTTKTLSVTPPKHRRLHNQNPYGYTTKTLSVNQNPIGYANETLTVAEP
eukprot:469107-Prorocentrum_minimum.AAC.3